jgi:hypothetical protein
MEAAPDWSSVENQVLELGRESIRTFSQEHTAEVCSFFAYYADPYYGHLATCLDTLENSYRAARQRQQEAVEIRERIFTHDWSWQNATYYLDEPPIAYHNPDAGLFEYQLYRELSFPDWQAYAKSTGYPKGTRGPDDYLAGNVRIIIWKAIRTLVDNDEFHLIHLAAPFFLGYQFHDESLHVLLVLNWPDQVDHAAP